MRGEQFRRRGVGDRRGRRWRQSPAPRRGLRAGDRPGEGLHVEERQGHCRDLRARRGVAGAPGGVLGSFASPGAVGMTKELCESLDVDVSAVQSLDELDTRLKEAVGRFYAAEVKLNSDFWNTYFNRRIESDVPAEVSEAVAGAKADDDIPFRWQSAPDHSERRRDLFVGDRWSV